MTPVSEADQMNFILEPAVVLLIRFRLPRSVASFVVCALALSVLYLAGLGIYAQVVSLYRELPSYSSRITELVDAVALRVEEMEQTTYRLLVPKRLQDKEKQAQATAQQPPVASRGSSRKRSVEPPVPVSPPPVQ